MNGPQKISVPDTIDDASLQVIKQISRMAEAYKNVIQQYQILEAKYNELLKEKTE